MRISDWSSDVCSSDLSTAFAGFGGAGMSAFQPREEAFALSSQQRSQWLAGLPAARLELEIKGPLALERLHQRLVRSEERRVGKEGVSACRSRWSQSN